MSEPITKAQREIVKSIYAEITDPVTDGCIDAALTMWDAYPDDDRRERMERVLCFVAAAAIAKVTEAYGQPLRWWVA